MKQVAAAIILKDNKILIARRPGRDNLAGKWEFPGGKVEEGETHEDCIKRELNEELSINVAVGEYFCTSIHDYSQGRIELVAYIAQWVSGSLNPCFHEEIRWVYPRELCDYDFAPADVTIAEKLSGK